MDAKEFLRQQGVLNDGDESESVTIDKSKLVRLFYLYKAFSNQSNRLK